MRADSAQFYLELAAAVLSPSLPLRVYTLRESSFCARSVSCAFYGFSGGGALFSTRAAEFEKIGRISGIGRSVDEGP